MRVRNKPGKDVEFFEVWDEITGHFHGEYATLDEALGHRQGLIEANPHYNLIDDLKVFWYRADGTIQTVNIDS